MAGLCAIGTGLEPTGNVEKQQATRDKLNNGEKFISAASSFIRREYVQKMERMCVCERKGINTHSQNG